MRQARPSAHSPQRFVQPLSRQRGLFSSSQANFQPCSDVPCCNVSGGGAGGARVTGAVHLQPLCSPGPQAGSHHCNWWRVGESLRHAGAQVPMRSRQVFSDVFGTEVHASSQADSASLGAAYRAIHAHLVRSHPPSPSPGTRVISFSEPRQPSTVVR
jgi:hypothetical protein